MSIKIGRKTKPQKTFQNIIPFVSKFRKKRYQKKCQHLNSSKNSLTTISEGEIKKTFHIDNEIN